MFINHNYLRFFFFKRKRHVNRHWTIQAKATVSVRRRPSWVGGSNAFARTEVLFWQQRDRQTSPLQPHIVRQTVWDVENFKTEFVNYSAKWRHWIQSNWGGCHRSMLIRGFCVIRHCLRYDLSLVSRKALHNTRSIYRPNPSVNSWIQYRTVSFVQTKAHQPVLS